MVDERNDDLIVDEHGRVVRDDEVRVDIDGDGDDDIEVVEREPVVGVGRARHGILSAIFHDSDEAESAYTKVRNLGYGQEEITVLMSEQARDEYFPTENVVTETERKTLEGTGAGGAIGAAVGAIAGAIAAIGTTVMIPGLGLVIAGPLAAAIAGAGAGGLTGGVLGALVGAGMTEERARVYQTAIEKGGVVMTVHPKSEEDADRIEEAWEECDAEEIFRSV